MQDNNLKQEIESFLDLCDRATYDKISSYSAEENKFKLQQEKQNV